MPWKTRKRGTKRQKGQHFYVEERPSKEKLPKGMKVVEVPEWSELKRKFKEPFEDEPEPEPIPSVPTDEEITQAGIEELLERASPEEIQELLEEETEVRPVRKRRHRTTEQEVDWTEIARRKRALKRHRPTIE